MLQFVKQGLLTTNDHHLEDVYGLVLKICSEGQGGNNNFSPKISKLSIATRERELAEIMNKTNENTKLAILLIK